MNDLIYALGLSGLFISLSVLPLCVGAAVNELYRKRQRMFK